MLLKTLHGGFQLAMSLVVLLVLVPLLAIPAPLWAEAAQTSATSGTDVTPPPGSAARTTAANRFCADSDCTQTRKTFRRLCDFIVENKSKYPAIFVGGYYMRDLVAGYEIFSDRKYLDTAIAYGDSLLKKQMPNGFWATGYGPVYLADTGSALSLFIVLYEHVDSERQKQYYDAVKLYTDSIQKDGMILPSGAFATGWKDVKHGELIDPIKDQYTLSSALTGATIFTWMYHMTGEDAYRQVAYRALKWVFSTMNSEGNIPYILAEEGGDWALRGKGNAANDAKLWSTMTYGTSAYVSEGVIAFDLYCDNPAWQAWIQKAVRPNIEFLLRNQLPDGTWSKLDQTSWDRTRSPGIVNYLTWYYDHVNPDPRVQKAVQRFDAYVTDPRNGAAYGLLMDGVKEGKGFQRITSFNAVTSLTGHAMADILQPGVDSTW